jgi:outer membrane protein assembly factor BamB
MSFDNSANFSYTGQMQYWDKPLNIASVYFQVKGAGGGGNSGTAGGGGGAYVFSNFNYLNPDVSYNNVQINVGGPGKAPPNPSGGQSTGGSNDPSGNYKSNGGAGTTYTGLTSGGGGGMSSVFFIDTRGLELIKIIAGGGGGAGINIGSTGGDSALMGLRGGGSGGGQGGNSDGLGDAGLGGVNGGANGYNFVDSSNNGIYTFIGGGGGIGGTFAGGGGGAGYGGGAGGKSGGAGGGGSYASYFARNAFIAGGGGAGGGAGQDGNYGSIIIYWNEPLPGGPLPVVEMFMLNAQHTSASLYNAPTILPDVINTYSLPNARFANSGVIGVDNELYIIADDGSLYAFDHIFSYQWRLTSLSSQSKFHGTPAIVRNGSLYISGSAQTAPNYLFAVIDTGGTAGGGGPILKWKNPPIIAGKSATSPVLDLSGVIYVGTDTGMIYAFSDADVLGLQLGQYQSPDPGYAITSPLVFDICYNKMAYTATSDTSSNLYALDISNNFDLSLNKAVVITPRWGPVQFMNEICGTPSVDANGIIYVNTNVGHIYAYDISSGLAIWANPISINDVNLSAMAIDNKNRAYCTSYKGLNVIDTSNGLLEWVYYINAAGSSVNSIPTLDASDNIYFGFGANYVYSINALTRSFNWKYQTGAGGAVPSMPLLSDNNNIYFGANNGKIYDLSGNGAIAIPPIVPMYMLNAQHTGVSPYYGPIQTPSLLRQANFTASNLFVLPSIAIAGDGTLYLGTNNGYLTALNASDFTQKWSVRLNHASNNNGFFTSPDSMYTTPSISSDGTIYVGSNEGYLYAVNPSNGALKWKYNAGYPLQSSPTLDKNNNIYFGAGTRVYSLGDAITYPFTRWLAPFDTSANVNSSPALGQNGFLYFGSDDGYVYALNSLTGLLQWKFNAQEPIYMSVSVDASNNVIIGNGSYMDGSLYYLDGATLGLTDASRKLWTNKPQVSLGGPLYNTVAVKGDTIYLSAIGHVYAIDRATGITKWKFIATNCYYTSPLVDASGTIYVASLNARTNHGTIHAFTDNGNSVTRYWPDYDTGHAYERLAPPVLGSDGTIYISSTVSNNNNTLNPMNMHIYAIK